MKTNTAKSTARISYHERQRPFTVTRGLPHYVIGSSYIRLVRLVREYDHMGRWHSYNSRRLIEQQCETLHRRVYGTICYYGGF